MYQIRLRERSKTILPNMGKRVNSTAYQTSNPERHRLQNDFNGVLAVRVGIRQLNKEKIWEYDMKLEWKMD